MGEQPIAWLWQNGRVLEDGCYQFYPTEKRADDEIAFCGGWKTPVFARSEHVEHGSLPPGKDVFFGLDDWRCGWPRLNISLDRAKAILAYMRDERTGEYSAQHPGRGAAHG